ncbi:hypothetical protein [Sphingomonas sp.]|uniref:hypothetical protein n=1 Tax=Sphingomonas sp. TaxID=28214 RepID=UPI003B3AC532
MQQDTQLLEAAAVIYRVCFTAAPIDFEEARRRESLMYRRAIEAAEAVRGALDTTPANAVGHG